MREIDLSVVHHPPRRRERLLQPRHVRRSGERVARARPHRDGHLEARREREVRRPRRVVPPRVLRLVAIVEPAKVAVADALHEVGQVLGRRAGGRVRQLHGQVGQVEVVTRPGHQVEHAVAQQRHPAAQRRREAVEARAGQQLGQAEPRSEAVHVVRRHSAHHGRVDPGEESDRREGAEESDCLRHLGVLSEREAREALHRPFRVADEANRPRGQPKPCRDAALAAAATTIPAAATAIITAAAAATTTAATIAAASTTAAASSSAACGRCLRSAVLEDVAQCGGQVCRRHVFKGKVPERRVGVGVEAGVVARVDVPAIVAEPDVVAGVAGEEGERLVLVVVGYPGKG
mmetsp:Transcript_23623/g.67694  ORF Transcript_23623/g.67694 Transcript_23623/m.67694 type:complete len:347 (-) Transcript_23623:376-1416(-)